MNMWTLRSLLYAPDAGDEGGNDDPPIEDPKPSDEDKHAKGLRDDLIKTRKELKEAKAKAKEYEEAQAARKAKEAEEQGEYKELADQARREADEYKSKLERVERSGKARDALLKAGADPKRLSDALVLFETQNADTDPDDFDDQASSFLEDRAFFTGDTSDDDDVETKEETGSGKRGANRPKGANGTFQKEYDEAHAEYRKHPNDARVRRRFFEARAKIREAKKGA